jgi:hypothetical protein
MTKKIKDSKPLAVKQLTTEAMTKTFEVEDKDLVDYLTPKQIRYCQLLVHTTTLNEADLAQRLNVTTREIKKWCQNEYVARYLNTLKRQIMPEAFVDKLRHQHEVLLDKGFAEYESRFDRPDENYLKTLTDPYQRQRYLARFATNAEFKDMARSFVDLAKNAQSLMPNNLESQQQISIRELVSKQSIKYEEVRRQRLAAERLRQEGKKPEVENSLHELFAFEGAQLEGFEKNSVKHEQRQEQDILARSLMLEQENTLREITITNTTLRTPRPETQEDEDD